MDIGQGRRRTAYRAEVGKMMTSYLRHIHLPSTQQVTDTAFVFKKGKIGRLTLTTLDLWEGRG
jgi:hypothetical protein